jgi:hypothetical protein
MKNSFAFILAALLFNGLSAQVLNKLETAGSSGIDNFSRVASSGSNTLVVAGILGGGTSIYLGADTLSAAPTADNPVLIKYRADGSYAWGFAGDDPSTAEIGQLLVAADGSIYIAGTFTDSITIGYKQNTATIRKDPAHLQSFDPFVAKLDSGGRVLWTRVFENDGFNTATAIALSGNTVYVSGDMEKTLYYDGGNDSLEVSFKSGFIFGLSAATGAVTKKMAMEGRSFDAAVTVAGMAVNSAGKLLVAGHFTDSVDFDPSGASQRLFNGGTGGDIFLSGYDTASSFSYFLHRQAGGTDDDIASDFALDASDHVWLAGYTASSSWSFGSATINATGGTEDILVLHFDNSGNPVKGINMGNTNTSEAFAIDVFGAGDVWVGGIFKGVLDFDPGTGTFSDTASTTFASGFIAKYDRQLGYLASFKVGDKTADESVMGLAVRSNDRVFATGQFQSSNTDFDPGTSTITATHNGDGDAFWADYTVSNCSIGAATAINGPKNLCVGDVSQGFGIDTVSGATSYSWSISGGNAAITGGNGSRFVLVEVLGSGNFSIEVTPRDGGCSGQSASLNVTVNTSPTFNTVSIIDPTCGQKNGQLGVILTGNGPYKHIWSSGDTTDSPQQLRSGVYSYTGYDSRGCSLDTVLTLNDNGAPSIDSLDITAVLCAGDKNGAIDLFVSGGTSPYQFKWSRGDTTEDISNAEAGGYRVAITDAAKCMSARIINIPSPDPLHIAVTEQHPSTCGLSNGAILLNVSGGVLPYTYQWNTGDMFDAIAAKPVGNYWCRITDGNNCKDTIYANLTDAKGPAIVVDSIVYPNCGQSDGAVYLTTSFTSSMIYAWTSGSSTSEDLTGVSAGVYSLQVTSGSCYAYKTFVLSNRPPQRQDICMVTVDDSSSLNTVVWEKGLAAGVKHYNIYRESYTPGYFHKMATWPVDSVSYWIDGISEPTLKSWTYRMDAESPCGVRSDYSPIHRTVHVVMNSDTAGAIRINWTCYAGFAFTDQKIGRFRSDLSAWESIDTVTASLLNYKDLNVPRVQKLQYAILIDHPVGCLAQRASSKNFNSSRSNRSEAIPTVLDTSTPIDTTIFIDENGLDTELGVMPNPSEGEFTLHTTALSTVLHIRILNLQGYEVGNTLLPAGTRRAVLDISTWPAGVYILHARGDASYGERFIKIIKQ